MQIWAGTNNMHTGRDNTHASVLTLSTGSGNGVWMTLEKEGEEKTVCHHGNSREERHVE